MVKLIMMTFSINDDFNYIKHSFTSLSIVDFIIFKQSNIL